MKIKITSVAVVVIPVFLIGLIVIYQVQKSNEPYYKGRPLAEWLRNTGTSNADHFTINQMLTLKEIGKVDSSGVATFEVPINYDVVTNIGSLFLLIDAIGGANESGTGEFQDCVRATNGDCLLEWNTTFDPPGKHLLQAQLIVGKQLKKPDEFKVTGPKLTYYSSNAVQFDAFPSRNRQ